MSLQSPDHPLTERLPERALARFKQFLLTVSGDRSQRLQSWDRILHPLADAAQSTVVICWEPAGQGFCWLESWGISVNDASPESEFTSDIVANAETVARTGQPDIFIGPDPDTIGELVDANVPDPLIRELVLHHRQLVLPVVVDGATIAVVELFQVNDLPEEYFWSLEHLQQLQRIIESWLNTNRWTDVNSQAILIPNPIAKQTNTSLDDSPHRPTDDHQPASLENPHGRIDNASYHASDSVDRMDGTDIEAQAYHKNLNDQREVELDDELDDECDDELDHECDDEYDDEVDELDHEHEHDELDHEHDDRDDEHDYNHDDDHDHSLDDNHDDELHAALSKLQQQQRALRLTHIVGRSLHETNTAYDIANELHHYFGEGRVSVAVFRGQHCFIRAFSNQQVFDTRSKIVVCLQRLAGKCVQVRRPLWHPEQSSEMPPDLLRMFDAYYEAADTQSIALLPLIQWREPSSDPNDLPAVVLDRPSRPGKVVGVVIVEGLSHPLSQAEILPQWQAVEAPVTHALANSRQHNGLFLMPVWKSLGQFADLFRGHHRNKALAIVAIVLLTVFGLIATPADFRLRCEGVIQPAHRSKIYAKTDGVVDKLLVADGDWVDQGQVLMEMSNPQLSAELADVEGKLRETRQKLKTCRLQRLQGEFDDPLERQENVRQCAGFEAALDKIQQQYDLLLEKQSQLRVTSPVAGQIVGWDLPRRLGARPVQPGQKLLTVADPTSDWELELKLADKRSGYLRDAMHQPNADPLKTSYVLASNPSDVRQGTVREVARSADVDQDEGNIVRVYVDIGSQNGADQSVPRPGTEVIAHIHAGRASLGYCKLYEFFDWVKRLWFKYA